MPLTSCRRVRQTGAVLGFLSGLAIVAWIGFGGPKPPAPALPVSTANCSSAALVTSHQMTNMTRPDQEEAPEYFYLYRISYAWTSAIGCLITVLVGIITGGIIGILVKYLNLTLGLWTSALGLTILVSVCPLK